MRKDSAKNAAWSFSSVVYRLLDHLTVIKRKYFILNKKAQGFVQTPVNDLKVHGELLITAEVRCNGLSLQGNLRANETT